MNTNTVTIVGGISVKTEATYSNTNYGTSSAFQGSYGGNSPKKGRISFTPQKSFANAKIKSITLNGVHFAQAGANSRKHIYVYADEPNTGASLLLDVYPSSNLYNNTVSKITLSNTNEALYGDAFRKIASKGRFYIYKNEKSSSGSWSSNYLGITSINSITFEFEVLMFDNDYFEENYIPKDINISDGADKIDFKIPFQYTVSGLQDENSYELKASILCTNDESFNQEVIIWPEDDAEDGIQESAGYTRYPSYIDIVDDENRTLSTAIKEQVSKLVNSLGQEILVEDEEGNYNINCFKIYISASSNGIEYDLYNFGINVIIKNIYPNPNSNIDDFLKVSWTKTFPDGQLDLFNAAANHVYDINYGENLKLNIAINPDTNISFLNGFNKKYYLQISEISDGAEAPLVTYPLNNPYTYFINSSQISSSTLSVNLIIKNSFVDDEGNITEVQSYTSNAEGFYWHFKMKNILYKYNKPYVDYSTDELFGYYNSNDIPEIIFSAYRINFNKYKLNSNWEFEDGNRVTPTIIINNEEYKLDSKKISTELNSSFYAPYYKEITDKENNVIKIISFQFVPYNEKTDNGEIMLLSGEDEVNLYKKESISLKLKINLIQYNFEGDDRKIKFVFKITDDSGYSYQTYPYIYDFENNKVILHFNDYGTGIGIGTESTFIKPSYMEDESVTPRTGLVESAWDLSLKNGANFVIYGTIEEEYDGEENDYEDDDEEEYFKEPQQLFSIMPLGYEECFVRMYGNMDIYGRLDLQGRYEGDGIGAALSINGPIELSDDSFIRTSKIHMQNEVNYYNNATNEFKNKTIKYHYGYGNPPQYYYVEDWSGDFDPYWAIDGEEEELILKSDKYTETSTDTIVHVQTSFPGLVTNSAKRVSLTINLGQPIFSSNVKVEGSLCVRTTQGYLNGANYLNGINFTTGTLNSGKTRNYASIANARLGIINVIQEVDTAYTTVTNNTAVVGSFTYNKDFKIIFYNSDTPDTNSFMADILNSTEEEEEIEGEDNT